MAVLAAHLLVIHALSHSPLLSRSLSPVSPPLVCSVRHGFLAGSLSFISGFLSFLIAQVNMPGLLGSWIVGRELYSHGHQTGPCGHNGQRRWIAFVREHLHLPRLLACLPDAGGHLPLMGMLEMVIHDHPHLSVGPIRILRGLPSHLCRKVVVRRLYVVRGSPIQQEIALRVLLSFSQPPNLRHLSLGQFVWDNS